MPRIPASLFQFVISLLLLILLVACGFFYGGFGDQEQADEAGTSMEQQIEPSMMLCKNEARDVLKKFCGECHQKSISRVPRALNVYDLEEDVWYGRLSRSQLDGIKRRIRRADNITKEEIYIVNGCIACLQSEKCR